ncbi:MAG: lasso peptide biosynthesis B2 protein [Sarcina sp.]
MRFHKLKNLIVIGYKFIKLPLVEKKFVIKIFLVLGYVRFAMLYRNFEKLGSFLGCRKGLIKINNMSEDEKIYIEKVVNGVEKISKITPWKSECLVQAATKMYFLRKKKIHGIIFLGVKKEEEKLLAHAWLIVNDKCISGNEFKDDFTSVDFYTN